METSITLRFATAALLLAIAGSCAAASLGPMAGQPVVGETLDLAASIKLDGAPSGSGECVSASVAYGDTPVSARVRAMRETGVPGQISVRVTSPVPVNEPVVTVLLRAGCAASVSRSYTLLAAAPATGAPIPAVLPDAAVLGAGAARKRATRAPLPSREANKSAPGLRASLELISVPTSDSAQRAAAAAAWRALGSSPAALVQSEQQLQRLEQGIAQLRESGRTTGAEIEKLGGTVSALRTERNAGAALAAVLALLGLALGWSVWRRWPANRPARTWSDSVDAADSGFWQADSRPIAGHGAAAVPMPEPAPLRTPAVIELPANVPSPAQPLEIELPSTSVAAGTPLHGLVELQEQVDFFVSLGQGTEAVKVLRAHIDADGGDGAYAWMQLHELLRERGSHHARQTLARRFEERFGFEPVDASPEEAGLEGQPAILAATCAAWAAPDPRRAIGELLLRRPAGPEDAISLAGYRDLFWLHALLYEDRLQLDAFDEWTVFNRAAAEPPAPAVSEPALPVPPPQLVETKAFSALDELALVPLEKPAAANDEVRPRPDEELLFDSVMEHQGARLSRF
ncbi:MAG: hypothetical protein HYX47_17835 [Burkholderiales bacterium]|nr:hypothetical protein [Burkholderiales bacterium]